jgi:hypothetical protein
LPTLGKDVQALIAAGCDTCLAQIGFNSPQHAAIDTYVAGFCMTNPGPNCQSVADAKILQQEFGAVTTAVIGYGALKGIGRPILGMFMPEAAAVSSEMWAAVGLRACQEIGESGFPLMDR